MNTLTYQIKAFVDSRLVRRDGDEIEIVITSGVTIHEDKARNLIKALYPNCLSISELEVNLI